MNQNSACKQLMALLSAEGWRPASRSAGDGQQHPAFSDFALAGVNSARYNLTRLNSHAGSQAQDEGLPL
jgi:hypothetical protein